MKSTTTQAEAMPFDGGHRVVSLLVALVLLTAAVFKGHQVATEPVQGGGFLDSRWVLTGVVERKLFLGLSLLADIWPKPTSAAALTCFSLFTCVSLCKAISGHASCGCFGRVPVNFWYTATLDLVIVFSLLHWRPQRRESNRRIHSAS